MSWQQIRKELIKRKKNNEPVETPILGVLNWIDEIGNDYVVVHSQRTGNPRKITSHEIEVSSTSNRRIKIALKQLGDC